MTVRKLCEALDAACLAGREGLEREVSGCYLGDLLSWVMSRAAEGDAWVTVMGNVNAVAVAKLADIACILLCEEAALDEEARTQADANAIPVLRSSRTAYELALALAGLLERESS